MSAIDTLLILDGIKGEGQDHSFPNSIQLLSFQFGGSSEGADNPAAGRVRLEDVIVEKYIDAASMGLWQAMINRSSIRNARIIFRRASGHASGTSKQVVYLEITLSDVYVVGMSISETATPEEGQIGFAKEKVTLNFSKIEANYTQQHQSGTSGVQSKFNYTIPRS